MDELRAWYEKYGYFGLAFVFGWFIGAITAKEFPLAVMLAMAIGMMGFIVLGSYFATHDKPRMPEGAK